MRCQRLARIACLLLLLVMVVSDVKLVKATTWSVNIHRFTTYTYYDSYAEIAQMQDGKIWLVWSKQIPSNLTLYYKTSSDLGITWSEAMNLTMAPAPGHNQNPSIIQAANGTIWLVWSSDRPEPAPPPLPDFYMNASPPSLSIPLGDTDNSIITVTSMYNFSNPVDLSVSDKPTGVNAVLNPTGVTPPPNSTATSTLTVSVEETATPGNYTLEVMGRSGKIIHTINIPLEITSLGESSEGSLVQTFSHSSESPAIQDYEIFLKTSHDNGETWSSDTQLTHNTLDDMRPSIVQLANGTIMLVWQGDSGGNTEIYYMTTSNGTSWSDAEPLTTDLERDKGPHVTQTEDGRIWVVWASNRIGDYEIYCKTYDGVSWSSDTRLTYSLNSDVTPSILQTVDDTIWIFWSTSSATSDNNVYYMYSSDNGGSWSGGNQFTTDSYEDVWPAVIQTRDTTIWVVWTSDRADQPEWGNWDIYYKTSLAGDVNNNGAVDVYDLSLVGISYGTFEGMSGYNADADINKDGIVDMRDLAIVTLYYGET
jgi:hypothetical protein